MIRRFACAVVLIAFCATATAQVSQFKFEPSRVPVGTAFHFDKSNIDGSRATRISVYVVDRDRLESFKWDEDSETATLVQARMDWTRFSVSELKSWQWRKGVAPELRGALEASADGRSLSVSHNQGRPVAVDRWPWHSYDFDFASLGLALPHLRDPHLDVIFWRTDALLVGEGVEFAQIGGVRLHFEGLERRDGREVRRYSIGGAGLKHLYGKLWTDATTGLLVEYQIPLGDEPGYKDVHLRLERSDSMTLSQWEAFKKSKIGER